MSIHISLIGAVGCNRRCNEPLNGGSETRRTDCIPIERIDSSKLLTAIDKEQIGRGSSKGDRIGKDREACGIGGNVK